MSERIYDHALQPDEVRRIYDTPCPVPMDRSQGGPLPVGRVVFDNNDGREHLRATSFPYRPPATPQEQRIKVNKTTHRIRFENETENEVTVVIERKNDQPT